MKSFREASLVCLCSLFFLSSCGKGGGSGQITGSLPSGGDGSGETSVEPPTLTAVSPTSGSALGGNLLTLTGTHFIAGMTVAVGGTNCTSVTIASATSATCVAPSKSSGSVSISVMVGTETATLTSAYTYLATGSVQSLAVGGGRSTETNMQVTDQIGFLSESGIVRAISGDLAQ